MTTYLDRPVFDFGVDWRAIPVKSYAYDLRERQLGFALPKFERLQSHTSRGLEFSLDLRDEQAIDDWDTFTAQLMGRMAGFWMPSPFTAFQIQPGVASNISFLIKDANLRAWLADHPAVHLMFTKPGEAAQFGALESSTATLDGLELVTLAQGLPQAVDETWYVQPLLYVRLADDQESATFEREGVQTRRVKVLELPTEYAALETGQIPVYLYEFWQNLSGTPQYWRLTGLNENVVSGGQTFVSLPIEHGEWVRSTRADATPDLVIKGWYQPENPLALFVPFKVPAPLWVKVMETTYANPNLTAVIFTGKVLSVTPRGQYLEAKCASFLDVMSRKFPRFLFQPRCNYTLYDACCGATELTLTVTITALSSRQMTVSMTDPPVPHRPESREMNWWALGYATFGSGNTMEVRSIRQNEALSAGAMRFRLDRAVEHAEVGETVTLRPGCDGSIEQCANKHFNFARWGGHTLPTENPTVVAIRAEAPSGNKK